MRAIKKAKQSTEKWQTQWVGRLQGTDTTHGASTLEIWTTCRKPAGGKPVRSLLLNSERNI